MTNTRPFLFFALCAIGFFLWQAWGQDYGSKPPLGSAVPAPAAAATPAPPSTTPAVPGDVPTAAANVAGAPVAATPAAPAASAGQRIEIRTDVLHAVIDTRGGNLVEADLLAYPLDPSDRSKPVHLLSDTGEGFFVAQSGLVSSASPAPDHKALFTQPSWSRRLHLEVLMERVRPDRAQSMHFQARQPSDRHAPGSHERRGVA
jgi:YidC/Oxa1 family membrane protein insertase